MFKLGDYVTVGEFEDVFVFIGYSDINSNRFCRVISCDGERTVAERRVGIYHGDVQDDYEIQETAFNINRCELVTIVKKTAILTNTFYLCIPKDDNAYRVIRNDNLRKLGLKRGCEIKSVGRFSVGDCVMNGTDIGVIKAFYSCVFNDDGIGYADVYFPTQRKNRKLATLDLIKVEGVIANGK